MDKSDRNVAWVQCSPRGGSWISRQRGSVSPGQMLQSAVRYSTLSSFFVSSESTGSPPPTRRPTLFHCSIFFLCVLVRVVPASCLTICPTLAAATVAGTNSNLQNNNNVLLPSPAAHAGFRIWHALACIWACRAARHPCPPISFSIFPSLLALYSVDPKLLAYRRSGPVPPFPATPAGGNWIDTLSILP
ncbi:hypothetical protein DFH94DRAFT_720283 [Russula ochroleuca]|uniref:Uncharacterized protein n=1 Tax=Russula ochroleuca TaxID=152965 RepID=A0A9P5N3R9_9AGAM|nr:hypothetical protein DFH94DRAFT_720283 [Russula ochroleuca]